MRKTPFKTNKELDAYFSGDEIQCLECEKSFRNLGKHVRSHGYSPDEYRDRWAIPRGRALAGQSTRKTLSSQMHDYRERGLIDNEHLAEAAKNIDYSNVTERVLASKTEHKEYLERDPPWEKNKISPGGKRIDGRPAGRCREYQQAYRALKAGDENLMLRYKEKYE